MCAQPHKYQRIVYIYRCKGTSTTNGFADKMCIDGHAQQRRAAIAFVFCTNIRMQSMQVDF